MKHFGAGGGSVINISSVASEEAVPTASVYSATKSAVDAVTRVLAAELGPRKIRVNAIAPGGVTLRELSAAISKNKWSRGRRSAGLDSPTMSRASPCSSPPTMPHGSPASGWQLQAVIAELRSLQQA